MEEMPGGPVYRYRSSAAAPRASWRASDAWYEVTGTIAPRVETFEVASMAPDTRLQRMLHRARVCRWHRHPLRDLLEALGPLDQGGGA